MCASRSTQEPTLGLTPTPITLDRLGCATFKSILEGPCGSAFTTRVAGGLYDACRRHVRGSNVNLISTFALFCWGLGGWET